MSEKPLPNFERGGMLCRLLVERQNGVSDGTDEASVGDLSAVLAALPVEQVREIAAMRDALSGDWHSGELMRRALALEESESRAATLEGKLREAEAEVARLREEWAQWADSYELMTQKNHWLVRPDRRQPPPSPSAAACEESNLSRCGRCYGSGKILDLDECGCCSVEVRCHVCKGSGSAPEPAKGE